MVIFVEGKSKNVKSVSNGFVVTNSLLIINYYFGLVRVKRPLVDESLPSKKRPVRAITSWNLFRNCQCRRCGTLLRL